MPKARKIFSFFWLRCNKLPPQRSTIVEREIDLNKAWKLQTSFRPRKVFAFELWQKVLSSFVIKFIDFWHERKLQFIPLTVRLPSNSTFNNYLETLLELNYNERMVWLCFLMLLSDLSSTLPFPFHNLNIFRKHFLAKATIKMKKLFEKEK